MGVSNMFYICTYCLQFLLCGTESVNTACQKYPSGQSNSQCTLPIEMLRAIFWRSTKFVEISTDLTLNRHQNFRAPIAIFSLLDLVLILQLFLWGRRVQPYLRMSLCLCFFFFFNLLTHCCGLQRTWQLFAIARCTPSILCTKILGSGWLAQIHWHLSSRPLYECLPPYNLWDLPATFAATNIEGWLDDASIAGTPE